MSLRSVWMLWLLLSLSACLPPGVEPRCKVTDDICIAFNPASNLAEQSLYRGPPP